MKEDLVARCRQQGQDREAKRLSLIGSADIASMLQITIDVQSLTYSCFPVNSCGDRGPTVTIGQHHG